MKERVLPDQDLARIAPMPLDQKRNELQKLKFGRPPYTYHPVRKSDLDILNVAAGPLAELPRTPWHLIAKDIRRRCDSAAQIDANLRVGEGLYRFASEHKLIGRRYPISPLPMGLSERVIYWSSAVIEIDGRMVVPFIDPRRTKKLTQSARQFSFSMMNQRISAYPDLADVGLAILQFENSEKGPRAVVPYFADDVDLFNFAELDAMVRETYEIWREILKGREAEARRSGGRGELL